MHKERGVTVVIVTNDLDERHSAEFSAVIEGLVRQGEQRFVVDLCGVRFIDSTGLSALVRSLKRIQTQHGALLLAGLQPAVQQTLALTRLERAFGIYPLVEDAVQALSETS